MLKTLTSFGNYNGTMQAFAGHWTLLNAFRIANGLAPLVLNDGWALGTLANEPNTLYGDKFALNTAIEAVADKEEAGKMAIAARVASRDVVYNALDMWRKAVDYKLKNTAFADKLPTLPNKTASDAVFFKPMDAAVQRWKSIDASTATAIFTPPLVLRDGTTRAGFLGFVNASKAATVAVGSIDEATTLARRGRDELLPAIKAHLELYRAAVEDEYPKNSNWVEDLPKLWAASGKTPNGVTIKVAFDAVAGGWKTTWKAPDSLDTKRFSVRISAGPRYKSNDERTIGDLAPDVFEFLVREADVPAGATVWVKVYVINQTDNEKGSNTVRLVR